MSMRNKTLQSVVVVFFYNFVKAAPYPDITIGAWIMIRVSRVFHARIEAHFNP